MRIVNDYWRQESLLTYQLRDNLALYKLGHNLYALNPVPPATAMRPDIRNAQQVLGLNVTVPPEEAIRLIGEAYRKAKGLDGPKGPRSQAEPSA